MLEKAGSRMFGWLQKKRKGGEASIFCSAVVPAAGSSRRMGGENKLFAQVGGLSVLARTVLALSRSELISEIVVATREEDLMAAADLCRACGIAKPLKLVVGGASRTESVAKALQECDPRATLAAVHDGARPLVTAEVIDEAVQKAAACGAAAPAVPVKDTIKEAGEDGVVAATPDRSRLFAVQTPQVFDIDLLRGALQAAMDAGIAPTDDCGAVERLGKQVMLTRGSYENIKITTPEDLVLAQAIWDAREEG